ncbi:TetR family transcriptional regulator [Nocardioides dongkuii]|uniref:TetR family transcriptional regulator n=1 Tax=Nocardioides dongkuii TaxID=2760089 RepID=UPI0015FE36C6|nr:TetR family transcriptional regulator [Nocardioides dongkuii]
MRDGKLSRDRLLRAATEEFAAHGIAGARVDRIATAAGVNKAQMYSWYGSKDGLFDTVFAHHLDKIVDAVPFDAKDLPGYAVALYDSYLSDVELVRLAVWNRLERVPVGALLAGGLTASKFEDIERAQQAGHVVADLRPEDVYALVIALAGTWSPVSVTVTASADDPDADHQRRKAALRDTVTRALVP